MTGRIPARRPARRTAALTCLLAGVCLVVFAEAQRGRGGGRGGRGGVSVMRLAIPAWPDGGEIPVRHAQAGGDVSPAMSWTGAPDDTVGFALIVRDVDAGGLLHWLVWNIPATSTSLPDGMAQGPEGDDGTRQISVSGPYYRGPAPPPTDPPHHYMFELYALDAEITVRPNGESAAETLAAVEAAMAGQIRGRATYVGRFGG
jgi:hypothetical protein